MNYQTRCKPVTVRTFLVMLSVFVAVMVGATTLPAFRAQAEEIDDTEARVASLSSYLEGLTPFVSQDRNGHRHLAEGAASVVPPGVYALAQEILTYQNRAFRSKVIRYSATAPLVGNKMPVANYPLLSALFADAKAVAKLRAVEGDHGLAVTSVSGCGNFNNPVPDKGPPHTLVGPVNDIMNLLLADGFHLTRGYACGRPAEENCGYDYTRERGYASCPAPAFRDQATRTQGSRFLLQQGEPNPELSDYAWPTWYWGAYAVWWHWTF